jgi:hypothetical protein
MYLRMVDGAGEERFMSNKTMLVIEEEHHEDFALQRGELQTKPVADRWLEVNASPGSRNWRSSRSVHV